MKKFLAKVKNSRVVKWWSVMSITAMIALMGCFSVFATDGESSAPDLSGTMTTAFTNIQNNLFSYIAIALPIALAIVGAIFAIKYAIRFFKNIANK